MTLERLEHQGAASPTGLASPINSSATSFTVLSGTGYPTGSVGPFVIDIDPGTNVEEKILCSSRSTNTFTVASMGRGWDGTVAASHATGVTNVTHVFAAAEADDDNSHIYDTTRNDHTQYAELAGATFTGLVTAGDGLDVTGTAAVTGAITASTTIEATTGPSMGRSIVSSAANLSQASATPAEIDPSLRVTVVVPASGMVRVTQSAALSGGSGLIYAKAGAGSFGETGGCASSAATTVPLMTPGSLILSGLTPGSTVFQMGWAALTGSALLCQANTVSGVQPGTWMMVEAIDT